MGNFAAEELPKAQKDMIASMPELAHSSSSPALNTAAKLNPQRLLKYFRACLADGDLITPNLRSLEVLEISKEDLLKGKLPPEMTEHSFDLAERDRLQRRPPKKGEKLPPLQFAPVLVAPLSLRRRSFHGWVPDRGEVLLYPLWISGTVDRSGYLEGDSKNLPWIPRQFLEPVTGAFWTLGSLEAFDLFLTRAQPPGEGEWQGVLNYAKELFQAVCGAEPSEYQHTEFEVLGPRFAVQQVEKGFRKPLIDLVDAAISQKSPSPILEGLAKPPINDSAPLADDPGHPGASLHLGQMTDRFPLSPSQRQSLACSLRLGEGEILAINGPPGTGKTTLVQSIVASLWVARALEGTEPPLIHVCSTNNQAVTNVLDSFDAAEDGAKTGVETRWLPDLRSYGLFFPANSKKRKAGEKRYQTAEFSGNSLQGSLGEMETARYVQDAHKHYLSAATKALGIDSSGATVGKILKELQQRLHEASKSATQRLTSAAHQATGEEPGPWDLVSLETRLQSLEVLHQDRKKLRTELLEACRQLPWYLELFDFLPAIRRRRNRRITWPFIERDLEAPPLGSNRFEAVLTEHVSNLLASLQEEIDLLQWVQTGITAKSRHGELHEGEESAFGAALRSATSPARAIPLLLDVGLRHHLFHLAGRYWEGRWLQEMEELLSATELPKQSAKEARLIRFRRLAKLTPALVSTLFRSPRIFAYYDREEGKSFPLLNSLDLLVVDEAGQVAPEIGAAVLPLAKRSVIIGDEHQIEPIWGIQRRVDSANLRAVGLDPERPETEAFRCSFGSLLRLAQRSTRWSAAPRRDGLILKEHRRCVPEIIAYCNGLVYSGQLEPHRKSLETNPFPALGWAHIQSRARQVRGSWMNPGEAWAIARWLAQHRDQIEAYYGGRPLHELVGIVTPFSAQRIELIKALNPKSTGRGKEKRKEKEDPPMAEVGTVHTFQGAEREIIIFSPVYSTETAPKKRFFDDGKNMLNVAVSRAKDSFLVMGDLELFDPVSPSPSGVLATHLFADPDNELTDVFPSPDLWRQAEQGKLPVRQLLTLEEHRQTLQEAFRDSQERILLISPYLTQRAVVADGVHDAIRKARGRGVEVIILYCVDLHRRPEDAAQVARELRDCGAQVHGVRRIHSKLLAVDRRWYVDGSFNWLGAVRDRSAAYHRLESSTRVEFFGVDLQIDKAWQEIEKRTLNLRPQ